jgi:hypothetical protein
VVLGILGLIPQKQVPTVMILGRPGGDEGAAGAGAAALHPKVLHHPHNDIRHRRIRAQQNARILTRSLKELRTLSGLDLSDLSAKSVRFRSISCSDRL